MAAKAWFAKDAIRKTGKRVLFSLLAVWVHCAVFFWIAIVLFHGKSGSSSHVAGTLRQTPRTMEVSLQAAPTAPAQAPAPDIQAKPLADEKKPAPAQAPSTQEPDKQTNDNSENEGILGCDSLAKRPERIIFGDDYVQFIPDGNPPGHVIVHEIINREGTVVSVTVEDSTVSKKMEDQIIAWAYRSFYHPGEIGGVAVDCEAKFMVSPSPYSH